MQDRSEATLSTPGRRNTEFSEAAAMPLHRSPSPAASAGSHSRTSSAGSADSASMNLAWKVVTIGHSAVGKTSAIMCATKGRVPTEEPPPTVGLDFVPSMIRGIRMQLWDTAGQPNHKSVTQQALFGAHYILYVFAIDSMESFRQIQWWRNAVRDTLGDAAVERIPAALIGNKADLEPQRQVPRSEAEQLAAAHGWLYLETSAKSVERMQQCMRRIGEEIDRLQHENGGTIPKPASVLYKKSKPPATIHRPTRPRSPTMGERMRACFCCCLGPTEPEETAPLIKQ